MVIQSSQKTRKKIVHFETNRAMNYCSMIYAFLCVEGFCFALPYEERKAWSSLMEKGVS